MSRNLTEILSEGLSPRWQRYLVGAGALEPGDDGLSFVLSDAVSRSYSDAQIDDYQGLPRRCFPWRPPLRLTVRACFSHPAGQLKGTAGFGFWNDPFMMTGARLPTLPRAVWFFYASPPSDMKLDLATPGCGWKAATVDALRLPVFLLAPLAPLAVALMNLPPLYRRLWPPLQRALRVREALLPVEMTDWHTYTLEWSEGATRFFVDGQAVLSDAPSPGGPLGFVMWIDNQMMVATPQGRFRWGLLDTPGRQWMKVSHIEIAGVRSSSTPAWGTPLPGGGL